MSKHHGGSIYRYPRILISRCFSFLLVQKNFVPPPLPPEGKRKKESKKEYWYRRKRVEEILNAESKKYQEKKYKGLRWGIKIIRGENKGG